MDSVYASALEGLEKDETLKKIEQEALQLLSSDPHFRHTVQHWVEQSKAFNERQWNGRGLQAQLKQELEKQLMAEASVRLFQVITSPDAGIAPQIAALLQQRLSEIAVKEGQTEPLPGQPKPLQ